MPNVNQFFLPEHLSKFTVRQLDYINEIFDGLKIENLEKQDRHISKEQYINYLKHHKFVPDTFSFEDMFSVIRENSTGFCNVFPVNLVGRNIKADPTYKGLEVELNFDQPNQTKWFMVIRYVYIGQQTFTKRADKQYSVDFKYYS